MSEPLHPIQVAKALAKVLHKGQSYGDHDYFAWHLSGVVDTVRASYPNAWRAEVVAWLHDAMEDTPITPPELYAFGFDMDIFFALELLTKGPGEDYEAYIGMIERAPGLHGWLARTVKIADLDFNIREINRTGKFHKNVAKYSLARRLLRDGHHDTP